MKYSHSWAVKMEMQYWDVMCTIVYCSLYVLQSIRFMPVKVSQMFMFGFIFLKTNKKRGNVNGDTGNRKNICLISPAFVSSLSRWGWEDRLAPRTSEQDVFRSKHVGGMERPVGWSVLKNQAFNQKSRSSAYLVVLPSWSIASAWYI